MKLSRMHLVHKQDCTNMDRASADKPRFLTDLYDSVSRTCAALSVINVLPAFLEANMWHHTDPSLTGFSLFAGATFLASLCLSPFLMLSKRVRDFRPRPCAALVLSLVEPIILLIAASPHLDGCSKGRTIALGIGVSLIPFIHSYVLCNPLPIAAPKSCCFDSCLNQPRTRTKVSNESAREVAFFPRRRILSSEILVAAFFSMCLRWCSGSVNAFYESWEVCCLLVAATLLLGLPRFLCSPGETPAPASDSLRSRNTSGSTGIGSMLSYESSTSGARFDSRTDSENLAPPLDESLSNGQQSCAVMVEKCRVTPPLKVTRGEKVILWVCAVSCGLSLGSSIHIFLWMFASSSVLRRFAALDAVGFEVLILVAFASGTIAAVALPWSKTRWNNRKMIFFTSAPRFLLATILIIATFLLLQGGGNSSASFTGSCIFAILMPQALTVTMETIRKISILAPSSSALGVVAIATAVTLATAQTASTFFVNPALTPIFLGKMGLIVFPEVLLIALSLFLGLGADWLHESKSPPASVSEKSGSKWGAVRIVENNRQTMALVFVIVVIACCTIPAGQSLVLKHCVNRHRSKLNNVSQVFAGMRGNHGNSSVSVMSWNVLFGHDMQGNDNLLCLAEVTQQSGADIVAVQESDPLPVFWGGKDLLFFLSNFLGSMRAYYGVDPLDSSLGVGLLTGMRVKSHEKMILPCDHNAKLPHYSMTKTAVDVSSRKCSQGSPCSSDEEATLYVFNIHAVFKNWTSSSRPVSLLQMNFIAEQIRSVDPRSPLLAIGDFNLNPFESELDVFYQELGLTSALHQNRSDSAVSTLRNRHAIVDHIFFRGMRLLEGKVVTETDTITDHHPIYAEFDLVT